MGPAPVSLWDLTRLGVCSLGDSLNSALQTCALMEGAARVDMGLQISFSEEVCSLVQGPRRARVVQQGDEGGSGLSLPSVPLCFSRSAPFDKTANITFSLNADDDNVSAALTPAGGGGLQTVSSPHHHRPPSTAPTAQRQPA